MDRSIKTLGLIEARVRLHPEVVVAIVVNIARSLAEAETQLKTGIAVTGEITDDEGNAVEAETPEAGTVESEAADPEAGDVEDSPS